MSWLALLLHVLLMAMAAPVLRSLLDHLAASSRGEAPPPFLQLLRDLRRLWRKTTPLPAAASYLLAAAPVTASAACTAAALLTPSFIVGMPTSGGADLLVVAGLLLASHAVLALVTHDMGWSVLAHAGTSAATARAALAPLVLAVAMAMMLVSGGTNLDAAVASIRDGGLVAHLTGLLAGLALLAAVAAEPALPEDAFPGRLGALAVAAGGLRFTVGIALAGAIGLPFGVASPGGGALSWIVGILCWVVKMGALTVLARALRHWRPLLPAAALLALAAIALASAQARA